MAKVFACEIVEVCAFARNLLKKEIED